MPQLKMYTPEDIQTFINKREGETKLGEMIQLSDGKDIEHSLSQSAARFVILGLPEDIGVRANNGIGGAHTAWQSFLKSFLNIQHNSSLNGADFLLLGEMDFKDLMANSDGANATQLRSSTAHIDVKVCPVIESIIAHGKIPVVIGGGHNNAYPLLKGSSVALNKALNVINLDAHSDFRVMEGRHSGNGFRYAYHEGVLKKYAMLGLHEAYNSEAIVAELKSNADMFPLFWDDIFIRNKITWADGLKDALAFVSSDSFGVELDVDCIENVLSSAATPVGIHTHHALQYLYQCGLQPNAAYLHLPEGVTDRKDGQHNIFTGKLLSYLVQAFVKGVIEQSIK
jgi:formiminoglutamase